MDKYRVLREYYWARDYVGIFGVNWSRRVDWSHPAYRNDSYSSFTSVQAYFVHLSNRFLPENWTEHSGLTSQHSLIGTFHHFDRLLARTSFPGNHKAIPSISKREKSSPRMPYNNSALPPREELTGTTQLPRKYTTTFSLSACIISHITPQFHGSRRW